MPREKGRQLVAQNKKARHDYSIEDVYEAGLVLTGTEVKSLREGRAQITDAYAIMDIIGRQKGIEKVRIVNKEGRVTFSSDAEDVGLLIDKRAEALFQLPNQPRANLPDVLARQAEAVRDRVEVFLRPPHLTVLGAPAVRHGPRDVLFALRQALDYAAHFRDEFRIGHGAAEDGEIRPSPGEVAKRDLRALPVDLPARGFVRGHRRRRDHSVDGRRHGPHRDL